MRKLGQNFLINEKIAENIIKYAKLKKSDIVLEIGPGKGILTKKLVKKAQKVIAIEIDKKMAQNLEELKLKNLEIIYGDALKIDFPKFNKIVSNLPYQISSKITEKFLDYKWDLAVLMYQLEFAKRICAKPGTREWSRISILVQYHCNAELLETVRKRNFRPIPKVDSAVVRLKRRRPKFEADDFFWNIVKILFQHKKKTVRNSLLDSKKFDKKSLEVIPEHLLKKRVFQCEIKELKKIADLLRQRY